MPFDPPEICPVCGADVPRKSLACPDCGADERTGWAEDADSVAWEEEGDFDYERFLQKEGLSGKKQDSGADLHPVTKWILFLTLIAFGLIVFFRW